MNILQNHVSLSFGNKEGISEEKKTMIKNIIQITEHNLDEEVTGFDLLKRLDNKSKCYSERS